MTSASGEKTGSKKDADKILKKREDNILAVDQVAARKHRNELLVDTDWTQGSDNPLNSTKKNEYKEYRQQLRDLTKDVDNWWILDNFPEKP